jgi:hypothetical protein
MSFVVTSRAVICLSVLATIAAWLLVNSARAGEVTPTSQMLASAKQEKKFEFPDDDSSYEYHFRNLAGHVLWCAYASGGNGGFCKKIAPPMIAQIDRAAKDYCKTAASDDEMPPHAIYGELWDLGYKCAQGRMSRLPVTMALDSEGYVRTQWKLLR